MCAVIDLTGDDAEYLDVGGGTVGQGGGEAVHVRVKSEEGVSAQGGVECWSGYASVLRREELVLRALYGVGSVDELEAAARAGGILTDKSLEDALRVTAKKYVVGSRSNKLRKGIEATLKHKFFKEAGKKWDNFYAHGTYSAVGCLANRGDMALKVMALTDDMVREHIFPVIQGQHGGTTQQAAASAVATVLSCSPDKFGAWNFSRNPNSYFIQWTARAFTYALQNSRLDGEVRDELKISEHCVLSSLWIKEHPQWWCDALYVFGQWVADGKGDRRSFLDLISGIAIYGEWTEGDFKCMACLYDSKLKHDVQVGQVLSALGCAGRGSKFRLPMPGAENDIRSYELVAALRSEAGQSLMTCVSMEKYMLQEKEYVQLCTEGTYSLSIKRPLSLCASLSGLSELQTIVRKHAEGKHTVRNVKLLLAMCVIKDPLLIDLKLTMIRKSRE